MRLVVCCLRVTQNMLYALTDTCIQAVAESNLRQLTFPIEEKRLTYKDSFITAQTGYQSQLHIFNLIFPSELDLIENSTCEKH